MKNDFSSAVFPALGHTVVLLLGSNMGDRMGHLQAGLAGLSETCGTVVKQSAVYESEVWGETNQENYLNLAVVMHTTLSPEEVLCNCQQIEARQGRERITKWSSRTLDIDILFYDAVILALAPLQIPHPLLCERRFVLEPLAEILPAFRHPQKALSVKDLLLDCKDTGKVWRWNEKPLF